MGLWSCSAENPFDSEGTGNVHLHTVVNSITTRALDSDYKQYLEDNCVVYISSKVSATEGKLIFKEKGLANVPSNIVLKTATTQPRPGAETQSPPPSTKCSSAHTRSLMWRKEKQVK